MGRKTFKHRFLTAPLDVEYSGILGVDVLKRMEARVYLWTSTLVLGRTSYRLSGQEVQWCALINRQPWAVREAVGMGLITPEITGPKASVGTPISGLSPGGSNIRGWDVVASWPVVRPSLLQGIFVGKMRGRNNLDVPQEVLVEPVGIGTPGVYVARVASCVYTQEELDTLGDLKERSERKTGTSRDKGEGEVNADEVSRDGKEMLLQANASNATRYCILKVLNTSRQHLEIGKHVKLGTVEAILRCAPRVTWFGSQNSEAGETSAGSVNLIRGNNSAELAEVRAELEQRIAHLVTEERQILMPVMNEWSDLFCNDREVVLPCTTKRFHEVRTGNALPDKKNPYHVPCIYYCA